MKIHDCVLSFDVCISDTCLVDAVQKLMFPNYDNGRFSVMDDGTLVIESVQKDDAGEYICKGLSVAGSAFAKARLDVRGNLHFKYCGTLDFFLVLGFSFVLFLCRTDLATLSFNLKLFMYSIIYKDHSGRL